jgi:hypothetical protein
MDGSLWRIRPARREVVRSRRFLGVLFLAALAFSAVTVAGPAAAQDEPPIVVLRFFLRIYGTPPPQDSFEFYAFSNAFPVAGSLCGEEGGPPCRSGEVYGTAAEVYKGDALPYRIVRFTGGSKANLGDGRREDFAVGNPERTYDRDGTVNVYYQYDDRGRPRGGGFGVAPPGWEDRPIATATPIPTADGLPETGAGDGADVPVWLIGAAVGAAVLAGAGFAVARRREAR